MVVKFEKPGLDLLVLLEQTAEENLQVLYDQADASCLTSCREVFESGVNLMRLTLYPPEESRRVIRYTPDSEDCDSTFYFIGWDDEVIQKLTV